MNKRQFRMVEDFIFLILAVISKTLALKILAWSKE